MGRSKSGIPVYRFNYREGLYFFLQVYTTSLSRRFDAEFQDRVKTSFDVAGMKPIISGTETGRFEGVMAQDLMRMGGSKMMFNCEKMDNEGICLDLIPPETRTHLIWTGGRLSKRCGLGFKGAVCKADDGIFEVDYSKIDVELRRLKHDEF